MPPKKSKTSNKKPRSNWLTFVKEYQLKHPHLTYAEALEAASEPYKRWKKTKPNKLVGAGVVDSIKDWLWSNLPHLNMVRGIVGHLSR